MSSPAPQGLRFLNPEAPGTAFYRPWLVGAVWRPRPTGGAVRQAMEVRVLYSGMRHPDPKLGKQGWTAESSTTMGWGGRRWCGAALGYVLRPRLKTWRFCWGGRPEVSTPWRASGHPASPPSTSDQAALNPPFRFKLLK